MVAEFKEMSEKGVEGGEVRPNLLKKRRSFRGIFNSIFVIVSSFNLVIILVSHIVNWFELNGSIVTPDERNLFLVFVVSNFVVTSDLFLETIDTGVVDMANSF